MGQIRDVNTQDKGNKCTTESNTISSALPPDKVQQIAAENELTNEKYDEEKMNVATHDIHKTLPNNGTAESDTVDDSYSASPNTNGQQGSFETEDSDLNDKNIFVMTDDSNFEDFKHTIQKDLNNLNSAHKVEDILEWFAETDDRPSEEDTADDAFDWFSELNLDENEMADDYNKMNSNLLSDETETDNLNDSLIYPGHYLAVHMSVLMIWMYVINHCKTGEELSNLLTLIGFHCITPHPALKSVYMFKKYFANAKSPLVKHYYCSYCLTSLNCNATKTCTNEFCLRDLSKKTSKSYFLEIPVESQVQNLFKRENFVHQLSNRFTRIKKSENNIEDIYDSDIYKSFVKNNGPLSSKHPFNISFLLNTDGVPIFKSSKMSIWPLYMIINELPFKVRKQRENMILCGLWFGDTKPFMPNFTEPLLKSLDVLEKGITVSVNNVTEICCGFLLSLTADLPAKSAIMNTIQFNGKYSCFKCLQKGKTYKSAKGGNIHVFPYDESDPIGPKRTKEICIRSGHEAYCTGSTVNGIKGPSFLMAVQSFDFVKSVSVDYMHCILQGITKLLISLWFGASNSDQPFSLYSYVDVIDERLTKVKPPSTISRMPRSISQHFKYWKASELRSWLLLYSVPVLLDVMSTLHLYHYSALVEAVYLLCTDSISIQDLEMSHKLLCFFVHMFESLYGERYLTLNMHSLLHLAETVKDIGPLWSHSCFPFENANGELLKLFHGTQYIDLQIASAVNVFQTLPLLMSEIERDTEVFDFICKIRNCAPQKANKVLYCFLGKGREKGLTPEEHQSVVEYLGHQIEEITFYSRISLRGQVYHSKDYTRVQVRNSFTVKYIDEFGGISYGYVCWYAKHKATYEQEKAICFIEKLNCAEIQPFGQSDDEFSVDNFLGISLKHIHVLENNTTSTKNSIIHVENILGLCVCIDNGKCIFVCDEPNKYEVNL